MSTPNGEPQVICRSSFSAKVNNPGTYNGPNLVPIPPAYIRDERYQRDSQLNTALQKVAPSSKDRRKQPLVDRYLPNPDIAQPSGALSNPVVQTAITCNRFETQSQLKRRGSQHHATPILSTQHSTTLLADRVSSTIDPDPPPTSAREQLVTPQYPLMHPGPVSNPWPSSTRFPGIPATARAWGVSENDMSAENVSRAGETRDHVQRLIDSWVGDEKTVLVFNGVFIPTVASFIIESYKWLSPTIGNQNPQIPSPPPTASIIIVNVLWLISLVLNVTSTLFATSTLMLQTHLLIPRVPRTSRDHIHSRSYLFLCTLSVFLFLAGLVIFFFTIHKIVGVIVLVVLIAIGLVEAVYLVLPPLCRAHLPL